MIGVQQRQRQRGLVAPRPLKFLVSAFHETPAVMQASQAVGRRQFQQLRLRLLPFGDLLLQLNRVLAESGQRSAEPANLAGAGNVARATGTTFR